MHWSLFSVLSRLHGCIILLNEISNMASLFRTLLFQRTLFFRKILSGMKPTICFQIIDTAVAGLQVLT